jgi:hypothetical protein
MLASEDSLVAAFCGPPLLHLHLLSRGMGAVSDVLLNDGKWRRKKRTTFCTIIVSSPLFLDVSPLSLSSSNDNATPDAESEYIRYASFMFVIC